MTGFSTSPIKLTSKVSSSDDGATLENANTKKRMTIPFQSSERNNLSADKIGK
jgi:hypothetical protein